ncbi:MAG: multiple monosaccharide ABC transporter permease [Eubacteriales bacterium]
MIKNSLDWLRHNFKKYAIFFALIVIMVVFQLLTKGILFKPRNVSRLIYQNSYILISATGMLMCILTGGNIDLSVGSVLALVSAMSGLLSATLGLPVWISIIVALLSGLLAGVWQGYWIAYQKIPAFIVTLAGMFVFRGINNLILDGKTIGLPDAYKIIAAKPVPDFLGKIDGLQFSQMLDGKEVILNTTCIAAGILFAALFMVMTSVGRINRKRKGYDVPSVVAFIAKLVVVSFIIVFASYWLALDDGLPVILLVLGVLVWFYSFITQKTVLGRHLYALGGNAKAAALSGIKTKQILFLAYANMGFLAAISGIVFAGRLNAASPLAGQGFELDAIAACFIGGASATGGVGTVMGAIIGGFIMGILNNGMSIMSVDVFWQDIIKGLVLLFAVFFDVVSKSKTVTK